MGAYDWRRLDRPPATGGRADALLESLQETVPESKRARWDESGHVRLVPPRLTADPCESLTAELDCLAEDWTDHIAIL